MISRIIQSPPIQILSLEISDNDPQMKKIITNLPLLATLAIASIMMLSPLANGQSAPSIAHLVEHDAAQNAEVVPTSTTDDEEDDDNSGGNGSSSLAKVLASGSLQIKSIRAKHIEEVLTIVMLKK